MNKEEIQMRKLRTVTVGTLVAVAALMTIGLAVRNAQAGPAPAPAVVGDWNGTLDTGSGTMKVVVHIAQDKDAKLNATLDSPDQGAAAMGIPISLITYKDSALHFEIAKMGAGYD